jgi:hypothetical protein
MKSQNLLCLFFIAVLVLSATATVFEAETSEDVDLFLEDFSEETIALMFYDSSENNEEQKTWFSTLSSRILGVFMSEDQYGRSTEDWVEMFDDKLHLMRIDVSNKENSRSKEEFNINDAPYIILMEDRRTELREKMDDETYDHIKDLLDERDNIKNKTGGAVLKSFDLEPEADAPDTKISTIQYFDLENDEPTNVEAPLQEQDVNWAPIDVIGPDGRWEERGRNWVPDYEIPNSGIKNQEDSSLVKDVKITRDDPRFAKQQNSRPRQQSQPTSQRRPTQATSPMRPTQAATQSRPTQAATQSRPTQAATQSRPTQATTQSRPTQSTTARQGSSSVVKSNMNRQTSRPQASRPQASRPQASRPQASRPQATRTQASRPQATRTSAPTSARASTGTSASASTSRRPQASASTSTSGGVSRRPYHSDQYQGFNYGYPGIH